MEEFEILEGKEVFARFLKGVTGGADGGDTRETAGAVEEERVHVRVHVLLDGEEERGRAKEVRGAETRAGKAYALAATGNSMSVEDMRGESTHVWIDVIVHDARGGRDGVCEDDGGNVGGCGRKVKLPDPGFLPLRLMRGTGGFCVNKGGLSNYQCAILNSFGANSGVIRREYVGVKVRLRVGLSLPPSWLPTFLLPI